MSATPDAGTSPEVALPVSAVTSLARDVLEGAFPPLWIQGEVSGFKAHGNGHWYFSLRDRSSQLSCVVWSRDTTRIPAPPDEGMQVVARGQLTVYAARGQMQFAVHRLEAEGEGLWRKRFELTRAVLEKDGLLDPRRKRALPRFPRTVAIVTSADGAALHDVVSVIRRRNPAVTVVLVRATVQGEGAPASLVSALRSVSRWGGAEVVIIGRGGGSREDLGAFNDERVARAIAACKVPIVSAVGHEVDVTIADLVADARAATPSAAAEAVVPVLADVVATLHQLGGSMRDALENRVRAGWRELRSRSADVSVRARRVVEGRRARLQENAARLDALSPLATLSRGYAVARTPGGDALPSAARFVVGDPFVLQLRDGRVEALATSVSLAAADRQAGTA